jgi:hypothetical protein
MKDFGQLFIFSTQLTTQKLPKSIVNVIVPDKGRDASYTHPGT